MKCLALSIFLAVAQLLFTNVLAATGPQQQLNEEHWREKVAGDSPAYYTGPPRDEQLFKILYFSIAPYPPQTNKHAFFILTGEVDSLPCLSEATLRLTITHNEDDVWWNRTEKLSKFPGVIRRDHHEYIYGGPLKEGQNDILTDFPLLWVLFDPGNYTLDVEAKLPDDRVLFSFAGTVYLESDWDW